MLRYCSTKQCTKRAQSLVKPTALANISIYALVKRLDTEFNVVEFGDKRLVKRFKQIMQKFIKRAQSNIASTFDSWSSIKGYYHFFSNDKVEFKIILEAHIDSTLCKIS